MSDRICPYPGLRPFSEDEAIFFQGREENVTTIASVLEQNRFLMLAGSSGDGKSSLVFAGLVPHCRAGFFRADYPSWAVAVFRPERSPVERLAEAVAAALGLEAGPVENSLRHGFSALVDLYLGSTAVGGREEGSDRSRLAASQNLLIVADQFEELFTNPENFVAGAPSTEARLCVNLLLETARLALAHDLPIYVVCTMRSDYIGQCNAFAGLPEMIGFSHYFVPRLTRAQLRRVVLEPARLNGDTIAPRLAERLIYDLSEGEDQLPLLQHALAAVWRQADEHDTILDLLAYYRCGGMGAADLPTEDLARIQAGSEALPEEAGSYGPAAVLNRHADDLFNQATQAEDDARAEWKLARAFTCLTGQDNGRMVRNRMTVEQIARTIETDEAAWPALEAELARMFTPFRQMAAGFVRPLIEEGMPEDLAPDCVLDITHEALIRNWDSLRDWTLAEHRRLLTWRELEPQVRRWARARSGEQTAEEKKRDLVMRSMSFQAMFAGRGSSHLLPIGPLNYFEAWQEETRPTAYWMARYAGGELMAPGRLAEEAALQRQTTELLNRSAKSLAMTRYVMRVGAMKIGIGTFIVSILFGIGLGALKDYKHSNGQVAKRAQERASTVFHSSLADRGTKNTYLLNAYAASVKDGATPEQAAQHLCGIIAQEGNDSLKAGTALDGAFQFLQFFKAHDHPAVRGLLSYADSLVATQKPKPAARSWVFYSTVRLHGYWKGLYFLSARARDKESAERSLGRIRIALPYFLTHSSSLDSKALATAVVYDVFYDLTDQARIGRWLNQIEGTQAEGSPVSATDSTLRSLFNAEDTEGNILIKSGKFLCNRLEFFTGIERTFVLGKRQNLEAVVDPIRFFLCQSAGQVPAVQKYESELVKNFETSEVSTAELSKEIYPVLLMAGNPSQLLAPVGLPLKTFWGDLFADPGLALNPALLTSGTYRGFLFNTELLVNHTIGRLGTPQTAAGLELTLGQFLFESAAPYDLALAQRYLLEAVRSQEAKPLATLAATLSDSAISLVLLPLYHVWVASAVPGLELPSHVKIEGPLQPANAVVCLSQADQRKLDSLTGGLGYARFANPAALWLSRWANPQTRQTLQEGLHGISPAVLDTLIRVARQSLLVTDSTLPLARNRQDTIRQVPDLYRIQRLLGHLGRVGPDYEAGYVPTETFGTATAALVPDIILNRRDFSAYARNAVHRRQIGDQNIEALRVGVADMYAFSGRYWRAFQELDNVYSTKTELYLLNNILFDNLDLRRAANPELGYYYRQYLLGFTSVNNYF